MKRNGFTKIEMLVVLVVVGGLAAYTIVPIFLRGGDRKAPRSDCQSNLKQIGLGFLQYVQDYDDKMPLLAAGEQGWSEAIQPYIKSWQIFQCPSERTAPLSGVYTTDYFYNSRLVGVNHRKLPNRAEIIMIGDGLGNAATDASLSALPAEWRTDSTSPAWRHLEGANYGYADAHVKWLKAEKVAANAFAIK
jgi:prepilin-type N-terminal cleavage/methylation domain-containing protein/prepilin-type processing-associated H-X9-DG protein